MSVYKVESGISSYAMESGGVTVYFDDVDIDKYGVVRLWLDGSYPVAVIWGADKGARARVAELKKAGFLKGVRL